MAKPRTVPATDHRFEMRRMPSTNDLFEIFPDLPGVRFRKVVEQLARAQQQVQAARERAHANTLRQRAMTERVRAATLRRSALNNLIMRRRR